MKTHENRALFSKAVLKVTTCLFLTAGVGISPVFAFTEMVGTNDIAIVQQQTVTITGVIKDKSGEPIIGANVLEKGTTNGVITNVDGEYTLKVKGANSVLVVSYIGYKTQEVIVRSQRKIDVALTDDTELLDEVVVIGYGTQRKGDVTSAIASVKSEDFLTGNFNNAGDLVKGKIAGLTITKPSGDPSAGSSITLRGVVSLNGNTNPLVLVDGTPGDLSTVPPENIASIDVLKDASAAAIYGTRGAAGVILITTKSGHREEKATATYSGYASFSTWSKKADFMGPSEIRAGKTSYNDAGYDTDWLKAISRTAVTQNHSFTITGGSKTTAYRGNITYRDAEGVMKKTGNDNLSMNFDVSHWMFNDMLKVNLNIVQDSYKYEINDASAIYRQTVIRNPTSPIWNEDGTYNEVGLLQYYNPVAMQAEQTGEAKSVSTRYTGNVTFEPIKGWQTNLMLATHRSMYSNGSYKSSQESTTLLNGMSGQAWINNNNNRTDYLEMTSKYDLNVHKHRLSAMVGYSYSENVYEQSGMWNANFPSDYFGYHLFESGAYLKQGKASMSSYKESDKLIGFIGRISYGYADKYNVLVSIRHEGSSKFGVNHKWGTFPAASLGWTISNEKFMKGFTWLDNLKVRGGYGVTGVIPGSPYQSIVLYNFAGGNYYKDGSWKKGLKAISNANPELKWEKAGEFNVGLDWSVLNGRISGSVDYYNKKTIDMLYEYAVPSPPNLYNHTWANVGKMRNSGIELMVKAIPLQLKNFVWETVVTLSHNSNKLLSLSNDLYETENDIWLTGTGDPVSMWTHRMEVGKELGRIYTLKAVGVSEATGLFLIENPKTGECAEFNQTMRSDKDWFQYVGNGTPKLNLGWNNTFRYKQFDLNMQMNGQFGHKLINQQRLFYENNSHGYNRLKSAADKVWGVRALSPQQSQVFTSYYVEDGDYLKMSNMTLGYTHKFKGNLFLSDLRVYGSVDNVFCITGYKGIDPELGVDIRQPGIDDRDKYPSVRSFTMGVNLIF